MLNSIIGLKNTTSVCTILYFTEWWFKNYIPALEHKCAHQYFPHDCKQCATNNWCVMYAMQKCLFSSSSTAILVSSSSVSQEAAANAHHCLHNSIRAVPLVARTNKQTGECTNTLWSSCKLARRYMQGRSFEMHLIRSFLETNNDWKIPWKSIFQLPMKHFNKSIWIKNICWDIQLGVLLIYSSILKLIIKI